MTHYLPRFKDIFFQVQHEEPLVSVITVVYNGDRFLERTIKSILDQTYTNTEYIIVDGASTDKSCDIIKTKS